MDLGGYTKTHLPDYKVDILVSLNVSQAFQSTNKPVKRLKYDNESQIFLHFLKQ